MPGSKPRLLILIVAYFAEQTIEPVLRRIPSSLDDSYEVEILVIDDGSNDRTFDEAVAVKIKNVLRYELTVLHNPVNQGYGGNQKIGYHYAIAKDFDFVALLHGDGQYAPELLPALIEPLSKGEADAVFGSRMIKPGNAIKGGMPLYKFVGNRILTTVQNYLLGTTLSEFHSGYRVYSVAALKSLPFERNSNEFHFDTEIIIQLVMARKRIKEIAIPTFYGDEISRVNGMKYAKAVVKASLQARLQRINLFYDRRFDCLPAEHADVVASESSVGASISSRVVSLIPPGSRILNLGSGTLALCNALRMQKSCTIVGCDIAESTLTKSYDSVVHAELDLIIPDFRGEKFDYILVIDVLEQLRSPEEFLDQLRALSARTDARIILTTANVGFLPVRISLMIGRFEYSKRGILDLAHTRLFTMKSLQRAMRAAGFEIEHAEGMVVPFQVVFGTSVTARITLAINRLLVRLRPTLFAFELLYIGKARPTLETLVMTAEATAEQKMPGALLRMPQMAAKK